MSDNYLLTHLEHEYQRLICHREVIRRRMREDIRAIERDVAMMGRLIGQMKRDRLHETTIKPIKPLTPEQSMRRAEKNNERQQKIRDVQASANKRIADIRSDIGR